MATFGPDGIFGHPDHITVGAATDAAFLRFAGTTGHHAAPQTRCSPTSSTASLRTAALRRRVACGNERAPRRTPARHQRNHNPATGVNLGDESTQGQGAPIGAAEEELITRVRAGDREAYAELVRRHAPMARRTAALLGAGSDADDVVQEALVKAYRALGGFREGSNFRSWLLKIVANETFNQNRKLRRRLARERAATLLADTTETVDPATEALSGERREELLSAVSGLSEPHRLVVTCRYLLDLDETETATVLGWPRGTVKSRLHRALQRLRTELDEPAQAKEAGHAHR